jgi:hypothetical protein
MKPERIALFVFLGLVFWLTGALIVRYLGDHVFRPEGGGAVLMFALALPIMASTLMATRYIAGLPYNALLRPVVIITFTAILVDGQVLTWAPEFYHPEIAVALRGAAWILWAGGVGLLFAYVLERRASV